MNDEDEDRLESLAFGEESKNTQIRKQINIEEAED